ncbi:MAG: heavy metal translocating P-type ATPase [Eggerthella lenta]
MRAPLLERLEELLDRGGTKKDVALLAVSAVALGFSFFAPETLPFNPAWIAIVLCGAPIILGAVIGLVTEFDIKADVLVSLALIAAVAIGEDFAAGEVALIMQLGALLEDLTVAKARAGIERLVHLSPRTARIVRDGVETVVAAEDVQVGDVLRVLPGETVAVDGTVLEGRTSIDESVMTGESLPVDKAPGDEVKSGTVNQFGAFDMRAQRVGEDSSLARMIELVQSADAGKAKIVRLADRWATWIVVIALTAAAGTWLVTGEIIRAVTILVVFCPCALVLATPTAIMAAIGNVTKLGVLVREGDALERLAKVRKVAFDKTGTLTYGRPEVVAVGTIEGSKVDEEQLYSLVASAESMSEHPLGKAVVRGWEQRAAAAPGEAATAEASAAVTRPPLTCAARPSSFDMVPGRGVRAWLPADAAAGNRECWPSGRRRSRRAAGGGLPFAEQAACGVADASADSSSGRHRAPHGPAAVRGIHVTPSRCCSPATMPRPRHRRPGRKCRGGG